VWLKNSYAYAFALFSEPHEYFAHTIPGLIETESIEKYHELLHQYSASNKSSIFLDKQKVQMTEFQ